MKLMKWIITLMLLSGALSSVVAQEYDEESIKTHPGYVDLEEIQIPESAERVTDISLGPALLRLMATFANGMDDREDVDYSGYLSIRVKSFEINRQQSDEMKPVMERIEKNLKKDKWERLMTINDKDDYTIVSMVTHKDKPAGLFIMSMEYNENVSFVNVAGNIDLEQISRMGLGINDSTMRSLRMHWN